MHPDFLRKGSQVGSWLRRLIHPKLGNKIAYVTLKDSFLVGYLSSG